MKKLTILIVLITFASFAFSQSVIVKDSEAEPNILLEINDEGDTGSISIPTGTAPSEPAGKLYNEGGTLKWNGTTLATGSSLWTLNSGNVYRSTGNVGIGTTSPIANLHISGDDGLLVQGTYGTGVTQNLGAGTRTMWYPKKAAFRVGRAGGTEWDDANMGNYSTAMGYGTTASGNYSFAMGNETTASVYASTAMGYNTTASGQYSTAMGYNTTASGMHSTSMGFGTTANHTSSTAMGYSTLASGMHSTAMGYGTTAENYASTAMGRYNVGGGNATSWESTDPVFEIGIGASSGTKANAVTVLKNGKVGIGTATPTSMLQVVDLPAYATDGAAGSAGLTAGAIYQTSGHSTLPNGVLMVKQ